MKRNLVKEFTDPNIPDPHPVWLLLPVVGVIGLLLFGHFVLGM